MSKVHDALALPLSWTNNHTREMATFIFIPPNEELTFKISYALPQNDLFDPRAGGSIQIRLKGIPSSSILVTVPKEYYRKKNKTSTKEKQINFDLTYQSALKLFQDKTGLKDDEIKQIYNKNFFNDALTPECLKITTTTLVG
jgi:hypothetical protein